MADTTNVNVNPDPNFPKSPAELPRTSRNPAPDKVGKAADELVKAKTAAADASAKQTEAENRKVADLRKRHDDLNQKVADATRYNAAPPEVIGLRREKADVQRQINEIEQAQARRTKDEMRGGVPVGGPFAS